MLPAVSTLVLALLVLPQADKAVPKPDVRSLQFVLGTAALKKHATVRDNALTITGGAGASYVSSINLGEFEAAGDVAMPAPADATLLIYASVDRYWHAKPRIAIPLPASAGTGWQTIQIVSAAGHLVVTSKDTTIAERDVPPDAYGRLGFDVRRGALSVRDWRVLRRDAGGDPRSLVALNPDLGLNDTSLQNVVEPRLVREVKPHYTPGAMRAKIQGDVELEAIAERDGTTSGFRIVKPLDDELDRQAIDAVRQWRFSPATLDGRPVRLRVSVILTFTLR